jgi:hypothetical protein
LSTIVGTHPARTRPIRLSRVDRDAVVDVFFQEPETRRQVRSEDAATADWFPSSTDAVAFLQEETQHSVTSFPARLLRRRSLRLRKRFELR